MILQYAANGLLVGALYACLAVGFSLVWGVLNIVNMMHGTFVVMGAYAVILSVSLLGLPPYLGAALGCAVMFALGYALQLGLINRVIGQPILISLTLTFGLDLLLNNALLQAVTASPARWY